MAEPKIGDRRNVRGGKTQWWNGKSWSYERPTLSKPAPGVELKTSKYEAIKAGHSLFMDKGSVRLIRNLGSEDRPQGRATDPGTRKATRGTRTRRTQAEEIATPDPEQRKAADQAMAEMAARGKVGHHGIPVSSVAAGKRGMTPERAAEFDRRYAQAGTSIGHTPQALVEMTPAAHNVLHSVEEAQYYRSIRQAGSERERVFEFIKGAVKYATGRPLIPMDVPSQERFGPGGMMSTIDLPHERQDVWQQ